MRVAVIGIGSNSVRLLAAQVEAGKIQRLLRDRAGTRLFSGLDDQGRLSLKSMADTLAAVRRMYGEARQVGAEKIHIFATSAVRDAGNRQEFSRMLLNETGCQLDICSGESEAALSFLGATDGDRCGVIDIGGGSTEYVIGEGSHVEKGISLQMGAVRLYRMMPLRDESDVPRVIAAASEIFDRGARSILALRQPRHWIGVGGTFTALAALVRGIDWTERACMHGTPLLRAEVTRLGRELANLSPQERCALRGVQPQRADIVVHGICILLASMNRLGLTEVKVSAYGNLDGYIKQLYAQGA